MNSVPNFDMKNPREHPDFGSVPVAKGEVSTGQRILRSFNLKVIFWVVLTILALLAFFGKVFVSPVGGNLLGDWVFFAGGLMLMVGAGIMQQKREAANQLTPVWLNVLLIIGLLVAFLLADHFLATNNFYFSLSRGILAGGGGWYAVATYRSNWAAYD